MAQNGGVTEPLLPIILLSLQVSGIALFLAAALGVPLGAWVGLQRFPGRGLVHVLLYTGMGLPPVVVGPAADPSGVKRARSLTAALSALSAGKAPFVSRGDDSGTHKKEQALWKTAGIQPKGTWYLSAGAGQAESLRMASERGAYALTDRGSYLALARTLRLQVMFQADPALRNPYALILVNPAKHPAVNAAGARQFSRFLLEPATQRQISAFGRERFGPPLFRVYGPRAR
jgi:ABC-type tungstate transport system permease subunit